MSTFDLAKVVKKNLVLPGIKLSWSLVQLDDWIDEVHQRCAKATSSQLKQKE